MKHHILLLIGILFSTAKGQTTDEAAVTETTQSPYATPCHGEWSEWSTCFAGTESDRTEFRDRIYILNPSQVDATTCDTEFTVNSIQTESCASTETPVQDLPSSTCATNEYQCTNFRCIPENHLCNGDDDCGDNSDEYPSTASNCSLPENRLVCGLSQDPVSSNLGPLGERYLTGIPGIEEFAAGFDILTGKFRSNVLSMAGHGSCRKVLISGVTDSYYRLPQNVASLRQTYDVTVEPGKIVESGANLLNDTKAALQFNLDFGGQILDVSGKTGLSQSDFIKGIVTQSEADDQSRSYASVDTLITTAQVLLKDSRSLETTTDFVGRLMELPDSDFSYSKYMSLIQDFGTHYVSGGRLGGGYTDMEVHSKCWLESTNYEDYSTAPWRETVRDCVRQSLFNRLNPDTSTLSSHCQRTVGETTSTLREQAIDYYVDVAGGSVDTASDLKFSFSKTTWDAWIKTIVNSPALNRKDFKLEKISNLVWSSSVNMGTDRKQKVADFIDQAIALYLNPYDAQTLCEPCAEVDTDLSDYTDDGDEVPVINYGVPYVTGTGEDYKCHCIYQMPILEDTCGALQNIATYFTLLLSLLAAYWTFCQYDEAR